MLIIIVRLRSNHKHPTTTNQNHDNSNPLIHDEERDHVLMLTEKLDSDKAESRVKAAEACRETRLYYTTNMLYYGTIYYSPL